MIRYSDLVAYTKRNHINWNTDLFEVLKGFFEEYSQPQLPHSTPPNPPIQQEVIFSHQDFEEPEDGEYTSEDLIILFST